MMTDLAERLEGHAADLEVAAQQPAKKTVFDLVVAQQTEIAKALPQNMDPERFTRILVTSLKTTPALQTCTAESLLGAVMLSAQLGLEPGPLGHCYLVPFGKQVTFIVGYKGLIDLMYRSGKVKTVVARDVREGDGFEFEYGSNPRIVHKPALKGRGAAYAYYAVVKLTNGDELFHVMSREDVEQHRLRSRSKDNGPWKTDYDAMARKTVIRTMSPYLPLTIETARAIANDEVVTTSIDADLADRVPDVVDVDGTEVPRPQAVTVLAGAAPDGGEVEPESAPDGTGDREGTAPATTLPTAPSTPGLVDQQGAETVGRWCSEAGIVDGLRGTFLGAFSDGRYWSAHEVPADDLKRLRDTLREVHAGTLVFWHDPEGKAAPRLHAPGDEDGGTSERVPPSAYWKARLATAKGVGPTKLLRTARSIAERMRLPQPQSQAFDDMPVDDHFVAELNRWLVDQVAEPET